MILNAALELITKQGFEETSMESIAENAEIATGTLYNYYGSRLTEQLRKNPPKRSPNLLTCEHAINELIVALQYFPQSATLFPKPITRQIYAYMFVLDPSDIAAMTAMDMEIMSLLKPILEDMKQADFLANEVDTQAAIMLLYGSSMMQHQSYIMMPDMTQAQLSDAIEMRVNTQLNGLLRRPS